MTTITIPNSVNTIGESAFFECTGLSSITIGNSISYIGNYAFAGLRRLTSIYIDDIEAWCNILFSNNLSNPLSSADSIYINGENITDIIIPNGVKSIGNYAFYGCDALTSVTIPNSLTNIGESAFAYCDGLTSISIPNSVVNIEDDAFKGCHYLENVTIGISVENIGMSAFENCNKLSTINSLNPTPPTLDVFCFSDGIKSKCDVFIPNGCLNKYMESDWKNFFSKIKETSSTKIDNILSDNAATTLGAFYDLLGNRRTFPVRGINITNGRKIIFK